MTETSEEEAFEKACGFLSYRQRTEHEMVRYLDRRGFGEVRDAVIARLVRAGLIDDRVFAETWVAERAGDKGYGSRRLRSELLRLGVNPSLVDEILESVYPKETEGDRAMTIAAKRWPKISGKDTYDRGRKLYSYLVRRGYDNQAAKDAVDGLIRSDGEER